MLRALRAEFFKLKRCTLPVWTGLAVLLFPLIVLAPAGMYDAAARRVGWLTFMRSGPQMIASGYGFLLFGLAAAYLFGMEYSEGTAKQMLSAPVRREYLVLAKVTVLAVWILGLTLLALGAQAGYAFALGLKGFGWPAISAALGDGLAVSLLIFCTLPLIALLAVLGKGYLAPMVASAALASVGLALAEAGCAGWFPWSMPLAVTGIIFGPPLPVGHLAPQSWALAALLFFGGWLAVLVIVNTADESG